MPSYEPPKEPSKDAKKQDKQKKGSFVANKVRLCVPCAECCKPRAIYAEKSPSRDELSRMESYLDDVIYSCGSSLFLDGNNPLSNVFFSRSALVCYTPVEKAFYTCKKFPGVCSWCGSDDDSSMADSESKELKGLCGGKKAYPICKDCIGDGYKPVTHGSEDKTGKDYKRSKGGKRKKVPSAVNESDDEEDNDEHSETSEEEEEEFDDEEEDDDEEEEAALRPKSKKPKKATSAQISAAKSATAALVERCLNLDVKELKAECRALKIDRSSNSKTILLSGLKKWFEKYPIKVTTLKLQIQEYDDSEDDDDANSTNGDDDDDDDDDDGEGSSCSCVLFPAHVTNSYC